MTEALLQMLVVSGIVLLMVTAFAVLLFAVTFAVLLRKELWGVWRAWRSKPVSAGARWEDR